MPNKTKKIIKPHHALGIFSIAMITTGSVDSIRNLPATALFGSTLIFFFVLGAILFLLPSALVSAELSSTSEDHGGVYAWVRNAFGLQAGFLAVWFQWVENIIWYPTILSFVAGTVGYLASPTLAHHRWFLITTILVSFWGTTLVNLLGIKSSARFSNFCAITGLIIPMIFIIILGAVWVAVGHPLQIHFAWQHIMPHHYETNMWVSLTAVMLSFCGMEIATVHAKDVRQPQHDYPRAMLLAVVIILSTLLLGSLSIAVVLPQGEISLVAGIMQAFDAFFSAYGLHWFLPIVALMLIIGGLGSVNNWIIAPTRGLVYAMREGEISQFLVKENRFGAPAVLLVLQALVVSIVAMIFLLLPSVNGSYWLLTALASQLYMIMYILMFAAAIRLRYKKVRRRTGFMIPGKNWGIWLVGGAGLLGSAMTLIIGFMPPGNIQIGDVLKYEIILISGLLIMSLPPFILYALAKYRRAKEV